MIFMRRKTISPRFWLLIGLLYGLCEAAHSKSQQNSTDAPVDSTDAPADSTDAPVDSMDAPVKSMDAPVESTDAPDESKDAPVESTDAPVESTDAPVESTDAPDESKDAPVDSTDAPVNSTDAPVNSTDAPIDSDAEEGGDSSGKRLSEKEWLDFDYFFEAFLEEKGIAYYYEYSDLDLDTWKKAHDEAQEEAFFEFYQDRCEPQKTPWDDMCKTICTWLGTHNFYDCNPTNLPSGPYFAYPYLHILYFRSSGITNVSSHAFSGYATSVLQLRNSFENFEPEAFANFTVHYIALTDNPKLTSLPSTVFRGVKDLATLHLFNNNLKSLPGDIFLGLIGISELSLWGNPIPCYPREIFEPLSREMRDNMLYSRYVKICPQTTISISATTVQLRQLGSATTEPTHKLDRATTVHIQQLESATTQPLPRPMTLLLFQIAAVMWHQLNQHIN